MSAASDMSAIVLAVTGLTFIAMGLPALVRPAGMVRYFGLTATTADLRNEIRAVYGGFGVAFGGLLLATIVALPAYAPGILLAAAVALLGMAGGRLLGFTCERAGRWPWVFGIIEVAAGAALLTTLSG